jgi:hypothetical protein
VRQQPLAGSLLNPIPRAYSRKPWRRVDGVRPVAAHGSTVHVLRPWLFSLLGCPLVARPRADLVPFPSPFSVNGFDQPGLFILYRQGARNPKYWPSLEDL